MQTAKVLPEVGSPMTPHDNHSSTGPHHACLHGDDLPEYEEDSGYGGDMFALTDPPAVQDAAHMPFNFLPNFLKEEPPAEASLPLCAHAFVTCLLSHLQELLRCLQATWQVTTRTITTGAMDCCAAGDEQGYTAHMQLFIELPARTLALPINCSSTTRVKLQCKHLLNIAAGKIPVIPSLPDVMSAQSAEAALNNFPHAPTQDTAKNSKLASNHT